jgi:hypothetical protein
MSMNPCTKIQIVALQSLYAAWERRSIPASSDSRSERLAWASKAIGREISSFSDLNRDQARQLIDVLKESMGQPIGEAVNPWRKVCSRDRAQAAGTAGRRGKGPAVIQIASPDDIARIDQAVARLGWSRDQYEAWLRSPRSPLRDKNSTVIRTVGEANKVWWALKNMLKRSGNWRPSEARARQTLRASV